MFSVVIGHKAISPTPVASLFLKRLEINENPVLSMVSSLFSFCFLYLKYSHFTPFLEKSGDKVATENGDKKWQQVQAEYQVGCTFHGLRYNEYVHKSWFPFKDQISSKKDSATP